MVAASEYFWATLGQLDKASVSRTAEWARANCVKHRIVHAAGGNVELYAQRPEAKSSKSFKMMMRAVFQNWGLPLDAASSDWLRLLSRSEFEQVAEGVPQVAAQAAHTPAGAAPSTAKRTLMQEAARLPADFDERSLAVWRRLQKEREMVACSA